jgi:type II secretory pathway component PulC
MNSKRIRIVLIVAAVLVWVIIIFKIVAHMGSNEEKHIKNIEIQHINKKTNLPDTFNLLLGYADPFLSGVEEPKPVIVSPQPIISKPAITKSQPAVISFPSIRYEGLVSNKQTYKLVGIVNISGKQYLAKQGEKIESVTIEKMYKDSILISNGQTKKWFHK